MKLQHVLLLADLLVTGFCTQAQQSNENKEYTSSEQQLAEEIGLERLFVARNLPTSFSNLSLLSQEGESNKAATTQRNNGLLTNQVDIAQIGDFNTVEALQVGTNNRTVVKQNGSLNGVRSEVTGNNNQTDITQNGSDNKVVQLFNANDQTYNIVQNGSENVLEQRGVPSAAPRGYSIDMQGTGIRIAIEQNKLP